MRRSLAKTVTPREVWSWAMYDFANSGYTAVVIWAHADAHAAKKKLPARQARGIAPGGTVSHADGVAVDYSYS